MGAFFAGLLRGLWHVVKSVAQALFRGTVRAVERGVEDVIYRGMVAA